MVHYRTLALYQRDLCEGGENEWWNRQLTGRNTVRRERFLTDRSLQVIEEVPEEDEEDVDYEENLDPDDDEWQRIDEPVQPRRYYARDESVGTLAV